jgi:hypothetical protein
LFWTVSASSSEFILITTLLAETSPRSPTGSLGKGSPPENCPLARGRSSHAFLSAFSGSKRAHSASVLGCNVQEELFTTMIYSIYEFCIKIKRENLQHREVPQSSPGAQGKAGHTLFLL